MPWVAIQNAGQAFDFTDFGGLSPPLLDSDSVVIVDVPQNDLEPYGKWGIEVFVPQRIRVTVNAFSFFDDEPAILPGQFQIYSDTTGWSTVINELPYPDYMSGFSPTVVESDEDGLMQILFDPPVPPPYEEGFEGAGSYAFYAEFFVELWVDDIPGPDGCFWDGKVMAIEDCDGEVDPPDEEWQPEFGHRTLPSDAGIVLRREHFCDPGTYSLAAAGGADLILTHIAARTGADPGGDGWECGDGMQPQPDFQEFGEPLFFSRANDEADFVMWTMPWEVVSNMLPEDYYGFVDIRCEVNNEAPFIIEGVAFAGPGL